MLLDKYQLLAALERGLFWIFPRRCAWCGSLTEAACALCSACEAAHAAQPEEHTWPPDHIISCYLYRSPARRQFFALKFRGKTGLAPSLGCAMAEALRAAALPQMPDLVCCVPMTEQQLEERGYNQSLLLARTAARHLALPFAPELLHKVRETGTQHGLPAREREANVAGAFAAGDVDRLRGKRVLLCDDVVTTGATLLECVNALLKGGAAEVVCLTFLRTVKRPNTVQ